MYLGMRLSGNRPSLTLALPVTNAGVKRSGNQAPCSSLSISSMCIVRGKCRDKLESSGRDLETVDKGVNSEVFEIFPHLQVFQQSIFNTHKCTVHSTLDFLIHTNALCIQQLIF